MSNLSFLIAKINEYKRRYETETYHPELNNLLIEVRDCLTVVSNTTTTIKELLKEGNL